MITCERVRPTHLERQAVVYVRQSSPHQVHSHHESRALQYALRQRLRSLWPIEAAAALKTRFGSAIVPRPAELGGAFFRSTANR